jgi:hypothetical protein
MPWQGSALINRLPQACVNRPLVVTSSRFDSPQLRPAPSISDTTSLDSISRTFSAPRCFSTPLRPCPESSHARGIHYKGFRFFFYSNEGNPREPVHVHVRAAGSEAKLWVEPQVRVAVSDGFDAGTLRQLLDVAPSHREMIERAWNDYFG